jgi:hypothetical protein
MIRSISLAGFFLLAGCGISGPNGISAAPIGGPPQCNKTNIINSEFNFDFTCYNETPTFPGTIPGFPAFSIETTAQCVPSQNGNPYAAIQVPATSAGYLSQQFIDHGVPQSVSFRVWATQGPVTVSVGIVFPTGLHEGAETILDTFTAPSVASSATQCTGLIPVTKSYSFQRSDFKAGDLIEIRLHVTSPGPVGTTANFDSVTSSP